MRNLKSLFCLLLVFLLVSAFASAQDGEAGIESVCMVTNVGNVDDGSFNQSTYEGMIRAGEDFDIETTVIESTSQAEHEANINTCIDEGYDVVLTVGFPMADVTVAQAGEHPDTYFIGVDQFVMGGSENLVGLQFREDQMGFLMGALAALMSESGSVAGVYGPPIPPVAKYRSGFEQGARFIDPEIEASGVHIDSFVDPTRGAEAAATAIGEGADVIMGAGGETGSGGITYAAQNGALVIGVDSDEYNTTFGEGETPGAENIISSGLKRVDNAVYAILQALVEGGDFPGGGIYVGDVSNGGVGFARPHDADVPEEVTAQIEEIFAGLQDGSIVTGVDPAVGGLLPTIPEALEQAGNFRTLLAAIEAAGLTETLTDGGPYTIFAPTDDAFEMTLTENDMTLEALLQDTDNLRAILLYHVVPNAKSSAVLRGGGYMMLPSAEGRELALDVVFDEQEFLMVNNATITATDTLVRNGVIHAVDRVLLPPV